ncbi:hypothetical protein BN1723_015912, partial [Verticillium longisporum]
MKATFLKALALTAVGSTAAKELQPNALISEIYDSGAIHKDLMARKHASWDRQIASGEMNSTIYQSRLAADGPIPCVNGVAAVVPGDRLNTFKCDKVDFYDFKSHADLGSKTGQGSSSWGWTAPNGREFVVVAQADGASFSEITSAGKLAVKVGANVKHIQLGDRVGVGAQARACLQADCPECSIGKETYCSRGNVGTYNSKYPGDEGQSFGGYADYNRTNGNFVVKIPDGIPSEEAAPMLCGGVTVFAPLKQNGAGPGKTVGIVGVGGLGHFGILFAKALGADRVVGISRKNDKREDVLKLGADQYI